MILMRSGSSSILALVISLVPRLCSQFSEQRHETSFYYSMAIFVTCFPRCSFDSVHSDIFGVLEPPTGGPRLTKGIVGHSGD